MNQGNGISSGYGIRGLFSEKAWEGAETNS